MSKRLAIIGSGDLGQLIAYHATASKAYSVVGFFDDFKPRNSVVDQYPILGGTPDVVPFFNQGLYDTLMIGIGYKHFEQRKALFEQLKQDIPFATIIHPSARICDSVSIGQGSIILPGCTFDRNVVIGENVLTNTGCVIAHDSAVGTHTFLSPAVAVAGFVKIGACCNIGINTTIIDNITITDMVQTGGGTVVIKDLTAKGLYVGNPARFVR